MSSCFEPRPEDGFGDGDTRLCLEESVKSKTSASKCPKCDVREVLRKNAFIFLTLAGIILGIILGFALQPVKMTPSQIIYFMFPGELLLQMLKMMILPLIISSLISGIASVDKNAQGRLGLYSVCYYAVTTISALTSGILLAVFIKPGKSGEHTAASPGGQSMQTVDAFLDMIRNMFPPNLVEACFRVFRTVHAKAQDQHGLNTTGNNETVPTTGTTDGVNILGLVVFSIACGVTLSSMGEEGKPLRDFFNCLNKVTMRLINVIIWYSPAGIMFLITGQILKLEEFGTMGKQIILYMVTVLTGLFLHCFLVLPLLYVIVTGKNPFKYMMGLMEAITTAFGTSSSAASLPITIKCLENNLHMDTRVIRFMAPIGTIMTMDGTALYETIATVFIAQVYNVGLSVGQYFLIALTSEVAAIGSTGVPQGGIITMTMVLASVGLPLEGISLIITVDWILDRLRTITNVLSDAFGVGIVQHLARHELQTDTEEMLTEDESGIISLKTSSVCSDRSKVSDH